MLLRFGAALARTHGGELDQLQRTQHAQDTQRAQFLKSGNVHEPGNRRDDGKQVDYPPE
jgi:hypothetical protein